MSELSEPEKVVMAIGARMILDDDVREAILYVGEQRVTDAWREAVPGSATAHRLLLLMAIKERMDQDDRDMELALELSAAGWTSIDPRSKDLPEPKTIWERTAVMSWRWRRPGKNGKPGRLYHSTNQAHRAMLAQAK